MSNGRVQPAPRGVQRMTSSRSLTSLMESSRLPTIPAVAMEIIGLVQRPDIDIEVLSATIARDPALAARVLKTANSGFYGRPRSVSRLRDAVTQRRHRAADEQRRAGVEQHDIAGRAGVSKPVLYQHFPGKLDLYLALLDSSADALVDAVRAALAIRRDE